LRSGTEQKAERKNWCGDFGDAPILYRKSPACVSRYAHLSIKQNLLQRTNFFFYYIDHFDKFLFAFSSGVVQLPVVVKIFADVGARIVKKEILSKLIHSLLFTVKYTYNKIINCAFEIFYSKEKL